MIASDDDQYTPTQLSINRFEKIGYRDAQPNYEDTHLSVINPTETSLSYAQAHPFQQTSRQTSMDMSDPTRLTNCLALPTIPPSDSHTEERALEMQELPTTRSRMSSGSQFSSHVSSRITRNGSPLPSPSSPSSRIVNITPPPSHIIDRTTTTTVDTPAPAWLGVDMIPVVVARIGLPPSSHYNNENESSSAPQSTIVQIQPPSDLETSTSHHSLTSELGNDDDTGDTGDNDDYEE